MTLLASHFSHYLRSHTYLRYKKFQTTHTWTFTLLSSAGRSTTFTVRIIFFILSVDKWQELQHSISLPPLEIEVRCVNERWQNLQAKILSPKTTNQRPKWIASFLSHVTLFRRQFHFERNTFSYLRPLSDIDASSWPWLTQETPR